jgi:hypothetical protein
MYCRDAASLCGSGAAAQRLTGYPIDPPQVSVSDISSGAFMAKHLRIAQSTEIMGVALVASGLYGCSVLYATADGVAALASQGRAVHVDALSARRRVFLRDLVRTIALEAEVDPPPVSLPADFVHDRRP